MHGCSNVWLLGGVCVVAPGGGCVWLFWGFMRGCSGGGMRGFRGGMHGSLGACMVALGGGVHGFFDENGQSAGGTHPTGMHSCFLV